jgi:hypothetical protein
MAKMPAGIEIVAPKESGLSPVPYSVAWLVQFCEDSGSGNETSSIATMAPKENNLPFVAHTAPYGPGPQTEMSGLLYTLAPSLPIRHPQ